MKKNYSDLNIQNTWSMSMVPDHPAAFHMLDKPVKQEVQFLPVMSGEVFIKFVDYPVMVEMWKKKDNGRHKKAWLATFTERERNKISRYYGRFYRWHLVTGAPRQVSCRLNTLRLLQRAVDFFASL